nr:ATP-binding protein [Micromonospora sp. DSM 115978]
WVRVGDPDSRQPHVQQIDDDALGGRGMHLVEQLADSWGSDPIPGDGKTVWFTLRRHDRHWLA